MSVITSVVAENTFRVIDVFDIPPDIIKKQIDAVFEDIPPDAVKIGMLSCPETMLAVAEKLRVIKPANVVLDPVMYAKNGCPLMAETAVDTLIKEVIPLANIITPNIPEAEKIAGMKISSIADMENAARKIHAMGCRAIVVKGGHLAGAALDVLFDGEQMYHFETERINTKNTHGTGCTFSSAIASNLAKGMSIYEAVKKAKDYVTTAIKYALPFGKGNGPTNHFYDLYKLSEEI
jgi:hydroxymethylpyrimidine/phosphomethylpyrimidine kinase